MNKFIRKGTAGMRISASKIVCAGALLLSGSLLPAAVSAQSTATTPSSTTLTLEAGQPGRTVSPRLYGLMTEEINHSYDGGLYGELIRNRNFKDDPKSPDHWSIVLEKGAQGTMVLDHHQSINEALTVCLRLEVQNPAGRAGIANSGYWGIPVRPHTLYRGSFYAKDSARAPGTLFSSIESNDGTRSYAATQVKVNGDSWHRYTFTLSTAGDVKPTADTRFVISADRPGTYWFNLVSLFPPTYHDRPNGNRPDLMKLLAAMKPSFLRFPGGNYLEGNDFSSRFQWKKTLGPLDQRPGHDGPWGYRSSDGMGLLEYLEWCEDLHMEPVLAVFAGYTLRRDYLTGKFLAPFVNSALDEIQYVMGDSTTKWGAVRARDGHPKPFKLRYVEVGNEDFFDRSGSYASRFTQFYHAIKARYPRLQVISTISEKELRRLGIRHHVKVPEPDLIDEHYYRNAWQMEADAAHYDHYSRSGPKIFVGEWATREGSPTTNFDAALGDAAWMTGMERNSDVVVMASYAPLFVNVNPGGMQWKSDLIGYNTLSCYGSPSYYAQSMFSNNIGDRIVPVEATGLPMQTEKLSDKDKAAGKTPGTIPALFYVATKDTATEMLFLNVVNVQGTPRTIHIHVKGGGKVSPTGWSVVLKAGDPQETNSITDPTRIVPVKTAMKRMGNSFSHIFPACSITVLEMKTR
jgi:alpha-N-arabinofuranosidase